MAGSYKQYKVAFVYLKKIQIINYNTNLVSHFFRSATSNSQTNVSTAASGDENRSPRTLFLMFDNKKKILGDKSNTYG